ncbi:hypothetical protein ABIB40_003520 [Pedobacter sp. UYP30]|uniref:DUF4468 domain-containing protein n=1 Tax=Pedobacter sp. UYP30 TaxID=1756400 RepID=UPI00339B1FB4
MRLSLIIGFALFAQVAYSQKVLTMSNDHKYTYYEVVVDDAGLAKDSLLQRARTFLEKKNPKDLKITVAEKDTLGAKGLFIIDKTILVASHPSGQVTYQFTFNAKDGRYRFWLTDFVYTPYNRDRYGNFVPKTNFGQPLENIPSKLKSLEWKAILTATAAKAKEMGDEFKGFMEAKQVPSGTSVTPKVVLKADW